MELGSYFLFLQEQIKDIIIIPDWLEPHTRLVVRSCTSHPGVLG
jgi:hypothetical protein